MNFLARISPRSRRLRLGARIGAVVCASLAGAIWFGLGSASAATMVGPDKTAWYDNSGAQSVTGETTPSAAQSGELEVSYVPASVSEPQETLPATPAVPAVPASPPGKAGGSSVGGTVAFAAVEYAVPLESQGQSIDPSSLQATLTLQLDASSSANVASGDLVACATNTPLWSGGGDQDASAAPPYSCGPGQAVTGNVSGNSVTFALSSQQESTLEQGVFSVVVVPGTSPSGAFEAVIEPPAATSMAVTNEAPLSNTNLNLAGSSSSQNASTAAVPGSSNFAVAPYSASSTTPAGPTSSGAQTSSTSPGTNTGTVVPRALGRTASFGGLGTSTQRTIAVVLLLALSALLAVVSSRRTREPKSLRPKPLAASG